MKNIRFRKQGTIVFFPRRDPDIGPSLVHYDGRVDHCGNIYAIKIINCNGISFWSRNFPNQFLSKNIESLLELELITKYRTDF